MAIPAAMSAEDEKDEHEHDLVMPGFRFHPTEEEIIEFYLRRKVEGKHFNVELITFLDLYRYDPWELPEVFFFSALAAIGEKEWFFYVPRDRKYRNGDRPNRVTISGYWKATGADRMIRSENSRPIGLKKTLVFYSGKAPKGIRSSWIMHEYRLPQSETDRYHKTEISLCRVYKRGGIEDHLPVMHKPSSKPTRPDKKYKRFYQPSSLFTALAGDSSSSEIEKIHEGGVYSSTNNISVYSAIPPVSNMTAPLKEDGTSLNSSNTLIPTSTLLPSATSSMAIADEFNKMVGCHQGYFNQTSQFITMPSQPQLLPLDGLPMSLATISDNLWEWNQIHEAGKDLTSFK
ncbi:protein ATAF2-like isoform X1 [Elaeis guineensis]|uniref:protein ATAF2-like isoform X1 n=1 Tax=Elaeis guineensis var. tenera TaxID=51953 RepID=UPI003C6D9224